MLNKNLITIKIIMLRLSIMNIFNAINVPITIVWFFLVLALYK